MANALSAFGKPKYKQEFGNNWSLKEGDQIYRLLPPFKSCQDTGEWSYFMAQHFGYSGVDPEDETKTRQRPFKCIQEMDWRTKMITKACPACDAIAANKEAWEAAEAKAKEQGKSEEEIDTIVGDWKSWAKQHNRDCKHYINAINGAGELGTLRITGKCLKKLKAEIEKIQNNEGFDPLDPEQGIYFTFTRIGKGIGTDDSVAPTYEDVVMDGKKFKQMKVFPLTEEIAEKAIATLPDLHSIGSGIDIPVDVIQMIVDSGDDPVQVDAAWKLVTDKAAPKAQPQAAKPATQKSATPKPESKPANKPAETKPAEAAKPAQAKPATVAPKSIASASAANKERFEAIKKKREEEAKAKAEAEAKAKAEAEAAAQEAEQTVNGVEAAPIENEMTDEQFMEQFGE